MGFTILGTGSALPERSVSNDELSEFLDTSDEWIFTRTGIKSRHVCTTESLDDLAVAASERALQVSGIDASQLDLIVCSTTTGDHLVPAEACAVAERLGAACPAFDVSAACAGFVFALDVAEGYIARSRAERVLVVAAEQMTRALFLVEIRIARGHREAVRLPHRRPADNLDTETQILRHAADHQQLLVVLLTEHSHVGPDVQEQPAHHAGNALEEMRPDLAFQKMRQVLHRHTR